MTSIVFDYADIRSRMLGEDKPKRAAPVMIGVDLAQPGSDRTVIRTTLPPQAWRKIVDRTKLHIDPEAQARFQAALRELNLRWNL